MENHLKTQESVEKTKTNLIVKTILPIISVTVVLIGLIILYQAGNVDQYITNEMRIGFGYILSFGLLSGYLFEKVRSTVFAQIVLSAVLSALTLTTIIATHGYKIVPPVVGLIILGIIFFSGLILARRHKSEIEFSTTAFMGLSITMFYSLDSFFILLLLEVLILGSLYGYLFFFEKVRFLHVLLVIVHACILVFALIQYTFQYDGVYSLSLYVYEMLLIGSLWVPYYFYKRRFTSEDGTLILSIILTILVCFLTFIVMSLQVSGDSFYRIHIFVASVWIALMLILQRFLLRENEQFDILHNLGYVILSIGSFILFDTIQYQVSAVLVTTLCHMMVQHYIFSPLPYDGNERERTWPKFINVVFLLMGGILAWILLGKIFAFVFHISIVEEKQFVARFIPPTLMVVTSWLAYFFATDKRRHSFEKGHIFISGWFFTALYFLYVPWQIMQIALTNYALLQLVLLSVLWGIAAYVATFIALKKRKVGFRVFTLVIIFFLLLKVVFVDFPFFTENGRMIELAIYLVFFGIFLLVLTNILIREFTQNGTYRKEWEEFIETLRRKPKAPEQHVTQGVYTFESQQALQNMQTTPDYTFESQQALQNMQATPDYTFESQSVIEPMPRDVSNEETITVPEVIAQTTENDQLNKLKQVVEFMEVQAQFNQSSVEIQNAQMKLLQEQIEAQALINTKLEEVLAKLQSND